MVVLYSPGWELEATFSLIVACIGCWMGMNLGMESGGRLFVITYLLGGLMQRASLCL